MAVWFVTPRPEEPGRLNVGCLRKAEIVHLGPVKGDVRDALIYLLTLLDPYDRVYTPEGMVVMLPPHGAIA